MKHAIKFFGVALIIFIVGFGLTACGRNRTTWISPMISFDINQADKQGTVFVGDAGGNQSAARIWSGEPIALQGGRGAGGNRVTSNITSQALVAGGAVRASATFAYNGPTTRNVRFSIVIDGFSGHSIYQHRIRREIQSNILVLWRDGDGIWWNIRESAHSVAGLVIPIDGNTPDQNFDFYIVVTHPPALRATDNFGGYIITFAAESPDWHGHFHKYEIWASTSTAVLVQLPTSAQ